MGNGAGTPPEGTGSATPAATAGPGPRFLARLLDALLVYVPAGLVLQLLGLPPPVFPLGGLDVWAWGAVTALVWFGYYVAFEAGAGGTLGKRLMKLWVVAADGRPPGAGAAAKRNLWLLFGLVPFVGGLAQLVAVVVIAVTISSSEHQRGKHDEFAGTAVMA